MQRKCFRIMWYVNTWLYTREHIIIFWTTKLIKILFSLSLNLIIRFAENDVHGFPKFQSEYEFHQARTTRISFFTILYPYPSYLKFYWHIHYTGTFFKYIFFSFLTVSSDSFNSSSRFNGTLNAYWDTCKHNNRFITGNTHIVCQNESTWTGIRKYIIGILFNYLSNWII